MMNDFLVKKADWIYNTINTYLPFEYDCKTDTDINGFLKTEWGIVFCFGKKINCKGRKIIIEEYDNINERITVVNKWSFKKLVARKRIERPTNVPRSINILFDIVDNNIVVKEDIDRWFYDFKTFNKGNRETIVFSSEFCAFIKFIVNEIVFFAKRDTVNFEINRREKEWFVELVTNFLINNYA